MPQLAGIADQPQWAPLASSDEPDRWGADTPDGVTLVAGWGCLGIGLLFMLRGARLIRTERRLGWRPLPGETISGREVLAEGVAFALVAAGNLIVAGGCYLPSPGRS